MVCHARRIPLIIRQDLRMILLDNYMLLTRDEEQGRLVVVSRVRYEHRFKLTIANTPRLSRNPVSGRYARETT